MGEDKKAAGVSNVIRIDEERIKDHLVRIVRGTVEDTLNALLDAEADRLCNATRYERTEARRDTRAGSYRHAPQRSARGRRWVDACPADAKQHTITQEVR